MLTDVKLIRFNYRMMISCRSLMQVKGESCCGWSVVVRAGWLAGVAKKVYGTDDCVGVVELGGEIVCWGEIVG